MDVRRQKEYQYMPFIVAELEDKVGGVSIALADLRKDTPVPPGAFVGGDDNGLGHILKSVELVANATATATEYKVKKQHQLVAGNFVSSKDVAGVKAYAITKIDTANADFDVVTVGTTLGKALKAGNSLVVVKEEDATGGVSELPYKVLGVTKREVDTSGSHAMVGVLTKGTVNVANMAFGAPKVFRDAWVHLTYED